MSVLRWIMRWLRRPSPRPLTTARDPAVVSLEEHRARAARERHPSGKARHAK